MVPEEAKSWLYVTGLSTSGSTAVVTFTATENAGGKRNADLEFVTVSDRETNEEEELKTQKQMLLSRFCTTKTDNTEEDRA